MKVTRWKHRGQSKEEQKSKDVVRGCCCVLSETSVWNLSVTQTVLFLQCSWLLHVSVCVFSVTNHKSVPIYAVFDHVYITCVRICPPCTCPISIFYMQRICLSVSVLVLYGILCVALLTYVVYVITVLSPVGVTYLSAHSHLWRGIPWC